MLRRVLGPLAQRQSRGLLIPWFRVRIPGGSQTEAFAARCSSSLRERLVQDAVHRSDELVDLERFPEDPRGAEEAADLPPIGTAAYDHDRYVAGVGPSFAPARDELRTVEVRKTEVEHDRRGLSRERRAQCLSAIDRRHGIE